MDFRGSALKNVTMTFKDGVMTEMSSESDLEGLRGFLDSTTGDTKMLSIVDIGVNPDSHPIEGSDYASWEMGGMVTLATGDNSWAGGNVVSTGALTLHLPGATLAVGETTVCDGGKLKVSG
jgi:hypothetical protein